MSLTFTRTVFDDLSVFLDECSESMDSIAILKGARGTLSGLQGSCPDYLKDDLKNVIERSAFKKDHIIRGLYLKAFASFENFFRDLVSSVVGEINGAETAILKDEIKERYIKYTGRILSGINSPSDLKLYNISDLLDSARSVDTDTVEWDGGVMSYDIKSINMARIEEVLNRVSIKVEWADIINLSKPDFEAALGSDGVKNTINSLEEFLKKSLRYRNRIAHLGRSASDVEQQDLEDLICVLRVISESICKFVEKAVVERCFIKI